MRKVPVIAVIGRKKSGKTSLIKSLIKSLKAVGYNVMSAKHVSVKDFTIDREGTDSWWHSKMGANPVVCVSGSETAVIYKDGDSVFSVDELSTYMKEDNDLILMEGFSRWILDDGDVGKIVMVKSESEYEEYSKKVKEPIICFCSYFIGGREKILAAEEDFEDILRKVRSFVEDRRRIYEILDQLPGLNCGRCSYRSCLGLAKAIHAGEASLDDCTVRSSRKGQRCVILIDGKEVPVVPFVSEIIGKAVLAMVSTLKGVDIEGGEHVEVKISKA
ncbi:molybdopterin-guanine dinucleotide biosynthesis protein B [Candidatus Bathyarchaeota archaeon]|nr:molybdopterin-guanine dinucleotide biosynthesis protein B [Candidatus Bathyarchaeota archaeon]